MTFVSIAVVDTEPVTLEGLAHLLEQQDDYAVVATGTTSKDMLVIAEQAKPAVMFVNPAISSDGLATISAVAAKHPNTKIVAYGALAAARAVDALEAGAQGWISKSSPTGEFVRAARAVISGDTYVSPNLASGVLAALRAPRDRARQTLRLSVREEQVIRLLVHGLRNKDIAERLGLSEKTVKHYMTLLMQKLQVRNRVEAVVAAQKLRLQ